MRDLLLIPFAAPIYYLSQTGTLFDKESFPLWERLLEKWGIGFVGLLLFGLLAMWTYRKEEKAALKREAKEQQYQEERVKLIAENNELTKKLITNAESHATKLEGILEKQIKAHEVMSGEVRHLSDAIVNLKK